MELFWAVIPALLLLCYYYLRLNAAPSRLWLLPFLTAGGISGFAALRIELIFENISTHVIDYLSKYYVGADWQQIQQSLFGIVLRQILEVAPIEEGCKLLAVLVPILTLKPPQSRRANIFLFTTAVALGFTAQENWVYFDNNTASIFDRLIGTPVHVMFSAPWGYALAQQRPRTALTKAWFNSVICHALVNILSGAWRYSTWRFLSYGMFPFLLWMFWRLEQLWRRVQGKSVIILISSTGILRNWQRGLVLFILMLGGNAIFGMFLLVRTLSPLSRLQLMKPEIIWFGLSRSLLNLFFGLVAWGTYRYLRYSVKR